MISSLLLLPLCVTPALPQEAPVVHWLQNQGAAHPPAKELVTELGQRGAKGLLDLERALGARIAHPAWERTLNGLPQQAVLRMQTTPSAELRIFGMLAAHRHGDAGCLGALVQLSKLPDTTALPQRQQTGARLADALAAIFRRDHQALPKLNWNAIPREHLPPLADRLGGLADPRAFGALIRLMDGETGLEQAALSAIAHLARTISLQPADAELRRVRYRLEHPAFSLRMLACQALGLLHDEEGAHLLQERLSDPSSSVRSAAHTALKRITGLRLHAGPKAWLSWIREQDNWWNERSGKVLSALPLATGAERTALLRELAGARLHRRTLTRELLSLLDQSQGESLRLLLSAIVALDSPQALPAITLLLSHPEREVRTAANQALYALRGSRTSTTDSRDAL